jgi:UDP-glucose:(heptosyl)LPS alpha-1,3-glucosyltransferase
MKIAMLTKHFTFRNGSSRAIQAVSTRLAARGHEVHVFCNRAPASPVEGVILRHVPALPFGRWGRALSFDWNCGRMVARERFDLVHGHGNTTRQDFVTVRICRKANLLARGKSLSLRDPHLFIERRQFKFPGLKRIGVLSNRVKDDLMRLYGIPAGRIVVIPNGVDARRFHPNVRGGHRARMRRMLGLSEDERVFLFVASGNFENRGLSNLIAALALLPDPKVRLLIVGRDRIGPYQAQARRLGVFDRLRFLPFHEHPEELHAAGDALIFPSYYDTFGNVPLEAMASGLPVVVTESCGMSELITNGVDGLILKDPADVEALATALMRLSDRDFCEGLGRKARETAERQSWDTVADRTLNVYEELLAERS